MGSRSRVRASQRPSPPPPPQRPTTFTLLPPSSTPPAHTSTVRAHAGSSSPPTRRHHHPTTTTTPTPTTATAVDFYRNPTILSRLILYQKYDEALERLHQVPTEASVWVVSTRPRPPTTSSTSSSSSSTSTTKDNNVDNNVDNNAATSTTTTTLRQLPLHMACVNLQRVVVTHPSTTVTAAASSSSSSLSSSVPHTPAATMAALNDLIANLAVAYPQSCQERDHLGRYPLHMAVAYGATPETVSILLMAWPASVHLRDSIGVGGTLLQLYQHSIHGGNRNNRHDDKNNNQNKRYPEMMHILTLEQEFWETARREARTRLSRQHIVWPAVSSSSSSSSSSSGGGGGGAKAGGQDKEEHDNDEEDEDVAGVASASSGSSSSSSSVCSQDEPAGGTKGAAATATALFSPIDEITPMAWEQLEERAIMLEHILTEVNISNYYLQQQIQALTARASRLASKLEHTEDVSKQLQELSLENEKLKSQIQSLKEEQMHVAMLQQHQKEAAGRHAALALSPRGRGEAPQSSLEQHLRKLRSGPTSTSPTIRSLSGLSLALSTNSAAPTTTTSPRAGRRGRHIVQTVSSDEERRIFKENIKLKKQYDDLNLLYHEQKRQLTRLQQVIQTLLEDAATSDSLSSSPKPDSARDTTPASGHRHQTTSRTEPSGTLSVLTVSTNEPNAQSSQTTDDVDSGISGIDSLERALQYRRETREQKKKQQQPAELQHMSSSVEIEWAPESALEMSDSLSFIFKAVSKEKGDAVKQQKQQEPVHQEQIVVEVEEKPLESNVSLQQEISVPALLNNSNSSFEPVHAVGMSRTGLFAHFEPRRISM